MKTLRALARGALRSLPGDFRHRFGDEILSDIDAEPERFTGHFLNVLKDGLAMRADDVIRDFTYAFARLRRAPLFVAIVTLTFALGIGANVAVFSALNAVVLQPLPLAQPDRLVAVFKRTETMGNEGPLTRPDVSDLRARLHGVTSISAIAYGRATLTVNSVHKQLHGAVVSSSFFDTIGGSAEIGRFFRPADALPGRHEVVISDRVWRSNFNGDPTIIGKRIDLAANIDMQPAAAGVSYEVIGVAPPGMQTPNSHPMEKQLSQPEFFITVPDATAASVRSPGGSAGVIAALAPGTSVAQLNAELRVVSTRLQALYPHADAHVVFWAQSLSEVFVPPVASSLWMILFAVFGILLIACANVANLIATRWAAREREVAIRRALGASNARIAAQLFIETGILAACGGIAGVALAFAGLKFIPLGALDTAARRGHDVAIDGTTLLFAVAVVCVTTVLAGLAPILSIGRGGLQVVLNSAGRGGDSARGNGLRSALVVAEVALALALVVSAGLVVRSYLALTHTPLGIRPDGVYETGAFAAPVRTSAFASPAQVHTNSEPFAAIQARMRAANQRLLSRVESLPGVDAAATTMTYPLGDIDIVFPPHVFGEPPSRTPDSGLNSISPDYFRALGIPVVQGRAFTNADSTGAPPVVIVNQAFVNKVFHGIGGVGRRVESFGLGKDISWATVVGVVANERLSLKKPPPPIMYQPVAQSPNIGFAVVVHAPHADLATERRQIQSAFVSAFPESTPPEVYTVASRVAEATSTESSAAALLGSLGLVPLLLALSGIFGVVSFSVAQCSREFGVRTALGARSYHILGDVLRRALSVTAIGIVIGTIVAAFTARAIASKITVSPLDPLTYGFVIGLVVVSASLAAIVPALRATRVDPVVALRYE